MTYLTVKFDKSGTFSQIRKIRQISANGWKFVNNNFPVVDASMKYPFRCRLIFSRIKESSCRSAQFQSYRTKNRQFHQRKQFTIMCHFGGITLVVVAVAMVSELYSPSSAITTSVVVLSPQVAYIEGGCRCTIQIQLDAEQPSRQVVANSNLSSYAFLQAPNAPRELRESSSYLPLPLACNQWICPSTFEWVGARKV